MGMQLIETIEVGAGGAASIEFTSIPQDGVDLVLVISSRTDSASISSNMKLTLNGATTGYNAVALIASTAVVSATSTSPVFQYATGSSATANTFSSNQIYLSNYASTASKSWSVETTVENNAADGGFRGIVANSGPSTAVTSIEISAQTATFVQYSTASLYKITAD